MVWQSESAVTVQPGETKVIVAKYDAPAYGVTSLDVAARDAGGNDITSSITVTPTYYAQRASLSVVNSSGLAAHLTKLRILGKPVVGAPDQEATRNSITHGANSAYFSGRIKRNRRVGGNPYVQSLPQAEMLAQRILAVRPEIIVEIPKTWLEHPYGNPGLGCSGGQPFRRALPRRIAVDGDVEALQSYRQ